MPKSSVRFGKQKLEVRFVSGKARVLLRYLVRLLIPSFRSPAYNIVYIVIRQFILTPLSFRVCFLESLEILPLDSAGALEPAVSDPKLLPLMERSAVLPSGELAACKCHAGTR